MTSRLWLTIVGVYAFLSGMVALLDPAAYAALLAAPADKPLLLSLRYFGAITLGVAVIFWSARTRADWDAILPTHLGGFVLFALAVPVGVWGTLSGAMPGLGWGFVGLDAVIAAGFAYFLLVKRAA